MEEVVFRVLLYLSVHDSSRALQLDIIQGPFEPCDKGRNLLVVALCDFMEVLHENIKQHYSAKNNCFWRIWCYAYSRAHISGHICCCPFERMCNPFSDH